MNTVRRNILAALGACACLAPLGARAQQHGHSDVLELNPPLPVETQNKIEVLEFFWYGCIHCYNLEPKLEPWIKALPKDVEFRRVPAVFNERWALDASIYYAMDALGLVEKLHRPLFDAIHRDRLRTDRWSELAAWLDKQGVDSKKFESTVKSFGVQGKTKRAIKLTTDYKIDGTPSMAVHGRYTVRASDAMLNRVNELVAAVRKHK